MSQVSANAVATARRRLPLPRGRRMQRLRAPGPQQRAHAVPRQEGDAEPAHRRQRPRRPLDDGADAADAGRDQDHVGQRADRDHHADVGARQPLPQHERVLRADRDDEGQAGQQAGDEGGGHDRDARAAARVQASECFCRSISVASWTSSTVPARGADRDRRPRHVRGGGPGPPRHAVGGQPADPGARVEPRPGRRPAHHALPPDRGRAHPAARSPARPSCCTTRCAASSPPTGRSGPTCRSPSTPTPSPPGSATSSAGSPDWDDVAAAAARRGPGVLRRPAAQRRGAGRRDLRRT